MTSVNVIVENLHVHNGLMLEGEIKKFPLDFEVRELHSQFTTISADRVHNLSSINSQNDNHEWADNVLPNDVECRDRISYLEGVIEPGVVMTISDINSGYRNVLQSIRNGELRLNVPSPNKVAVLLPSNMSKIQRGIFHSSIRELFPFLLTASMSASDCREQFPHSGPYSRVTDSVSFDAETNLKISEEVDNCYISADSNEQISTADRSRVVRKTIEMAVCTLNVSGLWISADHSLIELAETTISLADISSVYAFKSRGPHHKKAIDGIRVGFGLSRDERTKVYRIITSNCLSIDSKTAEDRSLKRHKQNHRQYCANKKGKEPYSADITSGESKSMIIFWKKKAIAAKGRRGISTDDLCDTNDDELYIGFSLCKYNTEHLAAMHQVATAVGVAVSDISFCGIKDKKALTFQRCVLTVRGSTSQSMEIDDLCKASPTCIYDCLKNLPNSLLRDRASDAIKVLLCTFPDINIQGDYSEAQNVVNRDRGLLSVSGIHLALGPLRIGDLWGNWFNIIVRNFHTANRDLGPDYRPEGNTEAEAAHRYLQVAVNNISTTGFPNFFGSQRMGYQDHEREMKDVKERGVYYRIAMPLGPSIGKLLLLGKYNEAISMIILGATVYKPVESLLPCCLHTARELFANGAHPASVLNAMPRAAIKECMLLKAMVRFGWVARKYIQISPTDRKMKTVEINSDGSADTRSEKEEMEVSARVLSQIPYSTRSLWVSAYQSWIWNRVASHRLIATGCDLHSHASPALSGEMKASFTPLIPIPLAMEGDLVHLSAITSNLSKHVDDNVAEDCIAITTICSSSSDNNKSSSSSNTRNKSNNNDDNKNDDNYDNNDDNDNNNDNNKSSTSNGSSDYGSSDGISAQKGSMNDNFCDSNGYVSTETPTSSTGSSIIANSIIVLTSAHIANLSETRRAQLFRDSVLLPLFGKKIIYPENENGRYV